MNELHKSLNESIEQVKSGIRTLKNDKSEGFVRECDISLRYANATEQIKNLEYQLQKFEKLEKEREEDRNLLLAKIQKANQSNKELKAQLRLLRQEHCTNKAKFETLKNKNNVVEGEGKQLKEEITSLQKEIQILSSTYQDCQDKLRVKELEIVSYVRDRTRSHEHLKDCLNDITTKWQASVLNSEKLSEQLKQAIKSCEQTRMHSSNLESELAAAAAENKFVNQRVRELLEENAYLVEEVRKINKLNDVVIKAKEEISTMEKNYAKLTAELANAEQVITEVTMKEAAAQELANQFKTRLEAAEKSQCDYKDKLETSLTETTKLTENTRKLESEMSMVTESYCSEITHLQRKMALLEKECEDVRREISERNKEIGHLRKDNLGKEFLLGEYQRTELQRGLVMQFERERGTSLLNENQNLKHKVATLELLTRLAAKSGGEKGFINGKTNMEQYCFVESPSLKPEPL